VRRSVNRRLAKRRQEVIAFEAWQRQGAHGSLTRAADRAWDRQRTR